jgi:hypothetical protein
MSAIAKNWKVLALIAAGILLTIASLKVAVGGSRDAVAASQMQAPAAAPAPAQHGEPISNEIRDFPQLD